MTSGHVTGNAALPDLVVVTNNPGRTHWWSCRTRRRRRESVFVSAPITVRGLSSFNGTPVQGQGVATGILSTGGNYGAYQDIAVAYAATTQQGKHGRRLPEPR